MSSSRQTEAEEEYKCVCAGAASIEVSNPEQASAVDVEMKDANGDADPHGSDQTPKPEGEQLQTGKTAEAAAGGAAAKGNHAGNVAKLETVDKKDRAIVVDEDLVRAFRYFDKTGKYCCKRA